MHALEEEGGRGGVSGEEGGGEVWKRTEAKGVGNGRERKHGVWEKEWWTRGRGRER